MGNSRKSKCVALALLAAIPFANLEAKVPFFGNYKGQGLYMDGEKVELKEEDGTPMDSYYPPQALISPFFSFEKNSSFKSAEDAEEPLKLIYSKGNEDKKWFIKKQYLDQIEEITIPEGKSITTKRVPGLIANTNYSPENLSRSELTTNSVESGLTTSISSGKMYLAGLVSETLERQRINGPRYTLPFQASVASSQSKTEGQDEGEKYDILRLSISGGLAAFAVVAAALYGLSGKQREEDEGYIDRVSGRNITSASLAALLTTSAQTNAGTARYSPHPDLESPRQYASQFDASKKTESLSNQKPTYLTNSGLVEKYNLKEGSKLYRGLDEDGKEIIAYFNVNDDQIRLRNAKTKKFVSAKKIANLEEI